MIARNAPERQADATLFTCTRSHAIFIDHRLGEARDPGTTGRRQAEEWMPAMPNDRTEQREPNSGADIALSAEARDLLAALPPTVAPNQLAAAYPRIFNQIAGLWKIPRQMDPYLDSLIIDERGRRQGFPAEIAWELLRLKDHYQSAVYPLPKSHSNWNSLI
jgi:hypothetical protein